MNKRVNRLITAILFSISGFAVLSHVASRGLEIALLKETFGSFNQRSSNCTVIELLIRIFCTFLDFNGFWRGNDVTALKANFYFPAMAGVFHLPKTFGNSDSNVNGTRLFDSLPWKFSGVNEISEKVVFSVDTSQRKCAFHLQICRLYHQFHIFRGILSGHASLGSLEWNLWQMESSLPKRNFRYKFSEISWKTPNVFVLVAQMAKKWK